MVWSTMPRLVPLLALSGCDLVQGAPTFTLFGAFFPAWMFCAGLGILAAIAARAVFAGTGLSTRLPFQLFVCTAVGLVVGVFAWSFWFGS